jgi:hypothetical protein
MVDDPTSHLIGPPEPDVNVGYGWENPRMYLDATSPAYWINEFIKEACGRDVVGDAVAPVTGDWQAYARFGSALNQLGEFAGALGIKTTTGTSEVDREWDGNAADAAHVYFQSLAEAIAGQKPLLHDLRDEYYAATKAVWDYARGVGSLLIAMADAVIIAAFAAAAGTATFKTGIGPVLGYGVAAWQTARVVKLAIDINTAYDIAYGLIDLASGNIASRVDRPEGDLASYPLPEKAYDHPAT